MIEFKIGILNHPEKLLPITAEEAYTIALKLAAKKDYEKESVLFARFNVLIEAHLTRAIDFERLEQHDLKYQADENTLRKANQKVLTELENQLESMLERTNKIKHGINYAILTALSDIALMRGDYAGCISKNLQAQEYYVNLHKLQELIPLHREKKQPFRVYELLKRMQNNYFVGLRLTKFGRDNIEEITKLLEKELEKREIQESLLKLIDPHPKNSSFYKTYQNLLHYNLFERTDRSIKVKELWFFQDFDYKEFFVECNFLVRDAEDEFRISRGVPQIGEGWVSETELFRKLERHYSSETVIHGFRSSWLGKQHIDIFLKERGIGIEYQGVQHDQPVDFFGGTEAHEDTKRRDAKKKRACKKAKIVLIEVRPGYDYERLIRFIDSYPKFNFKPRDNSILIYR